MDELERARAVLSAATPGPWEVDEDDSEQPTLLGPGDRWIALLPHQCLESIREKGERDARAIALLGSVWPELLAVVEECERGRSLGETLPEVDDALDALRARLREHLGGDR